MDTTTLFVGAATMIGTGMFLKLGPVVAGGLVLMWIGVAVELA